MAVIPELGLFVVADGMGGHRGGEIASAMAVEVIPEAVRHSIEDPRKFQPKTVISDAIIQANKEIHKKASSKPELAGMGTTTTALLFSEQGLTIGHVGDSRCYFFRPEGVWQATRDHSLVQEKLRAGLITRAEVKTDRMKNVITRSVGFDLNIQVETYEIGIQPGDAFLICSDGLSGFVDDQAAYEIVKRHLFDNPSEDAPQKTVEILVDAANQNGGDDNITAVLVQIT
jgi:protein phosphatase